MKRKIIFLLLCGGMFMNLAAQKIEVKEPQLIKEAGAEACYPKFTPDGKTLLLTSENYTGLRALNLQTKKVTQLSSALGAGYNTVVSDDSKTVYYRKINPDNSNGSYASFYAKLSKKMSNSQPSGKPLIFVYSDDLKIVVENKGKKSILTPNGEDEYYIWVALSPDRTKIVYTVSSQGITFVCDLSGKVLANLGRLNAPQWLSNDWVIGMDDRDDGHVVVSSVIVAVTADGKIRQNLTQAKGKIAMYPAASPAGDKIAFHTLDGELYIMDVIIKE